MPPARRTETSLGRIDVFVSAQGVVVHPRLRKGVTVTLGQPATVADLFEVLRSYEAWFGRVTQGGMVLGETVQYHLTINGDQAPLAQALSQPLSQGDCVMVQQHFRECHPD